MKLATGWVCSTRSKVDALAPGIKSMTHLLRPPQLTAVQKVATPALGVALIPFVRVHESIAMFYR